MGSSGMREPNRKSGEISFVVGERSTSVLGGCHYVNSRRSVRIQTALLV